MQYGGPHGGTDMSGTGSKLAPDLALGLGDDEKRSGQYLQSMIDGKLQEPMPERDCESYATQKDETKNEKLTTSIRRRVVPRWLTAVTILIFFVCLTLHIYAQFWITGIDH